MDNVVLMRWRLLMDVEDDSCDEVHLYRECATQRSDHVSLKARPHDVWT